MNRKMNLSLEILSEKTVVPILSAHFVANECPSLFTTDSGEGRQRRCCRKFFEHYDPKFVSEKLKRWPPKTRYSESISKVMDRVSDLPKNQLIIAMCTHRKYSE